MWNLVPVALLPWSERPISKQNSTPQRLDGSIELSPEPSSPHTDQSLNARCTYCLSAILIFWTQIFGIMAPWPLPYLLPESFLLAEPYAAVPESYHLHDAYHHLSPDTYQFTTETYLHQVGLKKIKCGFIIYVFFYTIMDYWI